MRKLWIISYIRKKKHYRCITSFFARKETSCKHFSEYLYTHWSLTDDRELAPLIKQTLEIVLLEIPQIEKGWNILPAVKSLNAPPDWQSILQIRTAHKTNTRDCVWRVSETLDRKQLKHSVITGFQPTLKPINLEWSELIQVDVSTTVKSKHN